jgi:uncharacterized damage-inducible protein DinB
MKHASRWILGAVVGLAVVVSPVSAHQHEAHGEGDQHGEHGEMHGEHAEMHGDHGDHGDMHAEHMAHQDAYREAMLANFDDASDKLMQLAQAFSEEQYAWRPAEGVRSVGEVMLHVAAPNYMLSAPLGVEMPEGLRERSQSLGAEGSKAEIIAFLEESIAHARGAIEGMDIEGLAGKSQVFGQEMSGHSVALILLSHTHEHLGQAIAYARSNGVVPPWSQGG